MDLLDDDASSTPDEEEAPEAFDGPAHGFDEKQVQFLKKHNIPDDDDTLIELWNNANKQTHDTTRDITVSATARNFAYANKHWISIFFLKLEQHIVRDYGRNWRSELPADCNTNNWTHYGQAEKFVEAKVSLDNTSRLMTFIQNI